MDRVEVISNNVDVIQWLRKLTDLPGHKFEAAIALAKTRTCKDLIISYDRIDQLTYLDKIGYSDDEVYILDHYYDELRKLKDSGTYSIHSK